MKSDSRKNPKRGHKVNRFKVGDHVIKNPATWRPSEFDSWGAGEGVGIIAEPPFALDAADVDVRWPAGRCFQREEELFPVTENKL